MNLLYVAQIVIALGVILVILLQARGGGGLGGIFGGGGESTFRTRRGLERTLFRFTIVLIAIFVILSMLSVRFKSG